VLKFLLLLSCLEVLCLLGLGLLVGESLRLDGVVNHGFRGGCLECRVLPEDDVCSLPKKAGLFFGRDKRLSVRKACFKHLALHRVAPVAEVFLWTLG